jgi:hypothetical protein
MLIAMSNALALISWHEFKFLHGDFIRSDSVWLLIGCLLALVAISALAAQAALVLYAPHRLQCRVGWPVDNSESTVTVSPSQAIRDGLGTSTELNSVRKE